MSDLAVCRTSTWDQAQIESYLKEAEIPLRLACVDAKGFPLVCSLWYCFEGGYLWCATHETAKLTKLLQQNPKCAFEVAPNDMPYRGVRGQGLARLVREEAGQILPALIDRYLHGRYAGLTGWLLGRVNEEYAIQIEIHWITSWDFSERMSD